MRGWWEVEEVVVKGGGEGGVGGGWWEVEEGVEKGGGEGGVGGGWWRWWRRGRGGWCRGRLVG